jgi:hypothetical protein
MFESRGKVEEALAMYQIAVKKFPGSKKVCGSAGLGCVRWVCILGVRSGRGVWGMSMGKGNVYTC